MNKLALILLASLFFSAACSGSNVVVNQQTAVAATNMEKTTANAVAGYATSTPPAGAQSMGMMSSPKAGNVTIPVTNVEVFVFTANVDSSGPDETLYWATDGQVVYVWGQIALVCVDDNGAETGETGTADFVYEADAQGYGWMTATDSCGYSTFFGCSNDGGGEVCGGCDFNDQFIACAAVSS